LSPASGRAPFPSMVGGLAAGDLPSCCMPRVPDSPLRRLVQDRRRDIEAAARRHKARSITLFGSVARGEETPTSDLDFLVEFEPTSDLFDLLHLRDELFELLGHPVDVVSTGGLKPRDRRIHEEAVAL